MNIEVSLTAPELWIIQEVLKMEKSRLIIKESELKGDKYNKQQLETIASNQALILSSLTKIFNAKGDAKDIANALA